MSHGAWIHHACPRCDALTVTSVGGESPAGSALSCSGCAMEFPRSRVPEGASLPLDRCAVCQNAEFYVQKDFNRGLGLVIVTVSSVLGFAAMLFFDIRGLLVLGAVTLFDFWLYRRLPLVAVCYLCQSVYHGFVQNVRHQGFYQGEEERFKAVRNAWLEGEQVS